MKTYFFNLIERYKQYSQKMDVQAVLCSKAWYVINDEGNSDLLIFKPDNTGYVSISGNTKIFKWEFITQNNSLIINYDKLEGVMLKPSYFENDILICQKDGTQECMFLVDDKVSAKQKLKTLEDIKHYFHEIEYQREQKLLQEQRDLEYLRLKYEEQERQREIERERERELKRQRERAKLQEERRRYLWEQFTEDETNRRLRSSIFVRRAKRSLFWKINYFLQAVIIWMATGLYIFSLFDYEEVGMVFGLIFGLPVEALVMTPFRLCLESKIFFSLDDEEMKIKETLIKEYPYENSYLNKDGRLVICIKK